MTPGGKGTFASLLDDLFEAAAKEHEEESPAAPTIQLDYLSVIEELHSGRITVSGDTALSEYRETGGSIEEMLHEIEVKRASIVPPPLEVEIARSTDPDDIARELSLDRFRCAEELHRVRRLFALANHPDRVPPRLRESAMLRMQVANMLIDHALRRLKS